MKKIKICSLMAVIILSFTFIMGAGYYLQSPTGYHQSLLNVCDYGAVPNDGEDDYYAFQTALKSSNSIYVPAGEYNISNYLVINYGTITGAGIDKTVIVADIIGTKDPIIYAGGRTQIRDLTIKYDDKCMTGTEIAGERVGIMTSANAKRRLCRGAAISNIKIQNVGTGIYSPSKELKKFNSASSPDNTGDGTAFSVTFESISVVDFSYRGFDMQAETRTGNVYRNIYLSTGKYEGNSGFVMDTEESESSISELTVANSRLRSAMRLNDAKALSLTNLNIIDSELTENNTGFLYVENSVIHIGGLNFKNSAPKGQRQSFIRVGDNMYRSAGFDKAGYVYIENLNIQNPELQLDVEPLQKFIARKKRFC